MFDGIKKRRAIRSYRTKLGDLLAKRYGKRGAYSVEQVRSGAYELGLALDPLCYAYAMHCTREDFDIHHARAGHHCDYDALRKETTLAKEPHQRARHDSDDGSSSSGDSGFDGGCDGGGGGD